MPLLNPHPLWSHGTKGDHVTEELGAYVGKRFTLWLTDENDEASVHGSWTAELCEKSLALIRPGGRLVLEEEWLLRIRPVPDEESRAILLGADYFLRLTVGSLPDGEGQFQSTGMRWPS